LGPEEYNRQYQDQYSNVLRLYFNQLFNALAGILGTKGGKYLQNPYGAFSSYLSQSTTANTATLLTLSNTDFASGVALNNSKIVVESPGIYNLQFSVQVQNLDNASQDMFIWLRQNGVDIVGSTGVLGLPARKAVGDPFHDIKGWNYFLSLKANDYIEIYWSTTIATVTIPTYAASATPTKPSTASVVATMSFVSALTA
jgi:hypothetical protein